MSWNSKVGWTEGLFLRPQHFQQQDRYHENNLNARVGLITPYPWGVTALEIDHDLAQQGKFAVRRCSGVMPDGMTFDEMGRGEDEGKRNFAEMPGTSGSDAVEVLKKVASAGFTRGRVPQGLVLVQGGSGATALASASSLNAHRSSRDPPPRPMMRTSHSFRRIAVCNASSSSPGAASPWTAAG